MDMVCFAAVFLVASFAHLSIATALPPLTAVQRQLIWQTPQDEEPKVRATVKKENENQHFLTCDEWHLDLFEPKLRGIGGAYAGVGTDQGYLFIGWMRPEIAWMTDYDPSVALMHEIYAAFFNEAVDAPKFYALWSHRKVAREVLQRRLEQHPKRAEIIAMFDEWQVRVLRRFDRMRYFFNKTKVKTFLDDAEQYSYVRDLVMAGRVRPMLVNLLESKGMIGIAAASRKLNVPLRALYLSNAEDYWAYPKQFKDNIAAQFFDDKSWIVRTAATKPKNGDYRYNLQAATVMQAAMARPNVRRPVAMVPWVEITERDQFPLVIVGLDGKGKIYP